MTVAEMRWWLMHRTIYSKSPKWQNRVKAMSDNQTIAVYCRLKEENELLVK